jgi:hypothetical protein
MPHDIVTQVFRRSVGIEAVFLAELAVLKSLSSRRHRSHHIVRFADSFEAQGHLCIAMENLHCNLR